MNSDPKNTVKDYLKNKVEAKKTPPESADEFIKRKLLEEPKDFDASQRSFWNRFRTRFQGLSNKMFFFRRKPFKRFMNETFPIVSFITFSCYVVLMMEEKYSEMRDKITASKSFKQMQIEQEDEAKTLKIKTYFINI